MRNSQSLENSATNVVNLNAMRYQFNAANYEDSTHPKSSELENSDEPNIDVESTASSQTDNTSVPREPKPNSLSSLDFFA